LSQLSSIAQTKQLDEYESEEAVDAAAHWVAESGGQLVGPAATMRSGTGVCEGLLRRHPSAKDCFDIPTL
jgi:hypothetical protein